MWRYILTKICKFLYFSLIFVNEYVWAAVHFIFNVPCMYVCEKRKEKTKNNFVFRKRNDRCDSMISNNLHACAREMVERLVCEIEKKNSVLNVGQICIFVEWVFCAVGMASTVDIGQWKHGTNKPLRNRSNKLF